MSEYRLDDPGLGQKEPLQGEIADGMKGPSGQQAGGVSCYDTDGASRRREDKVLLVLGASSDMGRRLIREVHSQYEQVLCHYRGNDSFLRELQADGITNLKGYQADFADEGSMMRFLQKLEADGYAPDHIVHLPAVPAVPCKFAKEKWETFELQLHVSVRSVALVLWRFLPKMAERRQGKVVFVLTSYVDGTPPKYLSAYVTAKYALLGLMQDLAAEYAQTGVQINGVSPEMVETKFLSSLSEHIVESNAASSPRGRNLSVEEVTPTLRFLLSEESNGITGENIVITGGK